MEGGRNEVRRERGVRGKLRLRNRGTSEWYKVRVRKRGNEEKREERNGNSGGREGGREIRRGRERKGDKER